MTWSDKVIAKLTELDALHACAACGVRKFHVERFPVSAAGGSVEVALLACKNCGLVRSHAMEILKP